jgi:hypothetical protein
VLFIIIFSGCTAQRGLWPPRSRGFLITHNDASQSVGLLWTSDQLVAETSTWRHTQQTNIHAPSGIRTYDRSRRAAVDLRIRPRGHWDRRIVMLKTLFLLFKCIDTRFKEFSLLFIYWRFIIPKRLLTCVCFFFFVFYAVAGLWLCPMQTLHNTDSMTDTKFHLRTFYEPFLLERDLSQSALQNQSLNAVSGIDWRWFWESFDVN